MARKNRVSIPNGIYHITSRIVNRQFWFRDPKLKSEIVRWLYGIARFSGVELLAWCIMDNHFHLFVHVPDVPVEYRQNPHVVPNAYAFGMRPPECNVPLWSPHEEGRRRDAQRGEATRPDLQFMLSDDEMLDRLEALYGDRRRIEVMRTNWRNMRVLGNGGAVDAIKRRYCRRMYNLSQFTKTLKERIAQCINKRLGHAGHVFEGRFHSGLVQGDRAVAELVALYIDYNPRRARLVREGECYRWSSFGQAEGNGPHAATCRAAYERIFGCAWREARERILAAFLAKQTRNLEVKNASHVLSARVKLDELIKFRIAALSRGHFIGRGLGFSEEVRAHMARNFPHAGFSSLRWLSRSVEWPRASVFVA